jgi:hypothetical protein
MDDDFVIASHIFDPVPTRVIYFKQQSGFAARTRSNILDQDTVPLTWNREVGAQALVHFKGHCINEVSKYHDYGGLFGSISNAIHDAERKIEQWEVGDSTGLEILVVARMRDTPTLGYSHEEYGRKLFHALNNDRLFEFTEEAKLGVPFSNDAFHPSKRKIIQAFDHGLTTVWSSFWTDIKKHEKLEAFKVATLDDQTNRTIYPNDEIDIRE